MATTLTDDDFKAIETYLAGKGVDFDNEVSAPESADKVPVVRGSEGKYITYQNLVDDLALGYFKEDTLIVHHDAVEGVEEVGHWETIREYESGGKDVEWIVETEGVEARDAYDEEVKIDVYIPYSEEELTRRSLRQEKEEAEKWFKAHDYIGVKIATGRATIEEYADEIAEMSRLADRINEIDKLL